MNNRVVFVDDEKGILDAITRAFRNESYKIYAFDDPATAIEEIHVIKPAVVVSDRMMPSMDGSEFLEKVRVRWPSIVRIMLTGHSDIDATINVINKGHIFRFINKPWNRTELKMSVKNGVDHFNLAMDNKQMTQVIKQKNEALLALNSDVEGRLQECLARVEEAGKQYNALNIHLQEILTSILNDIEHAKGS